MNNSELYIAQINKIFRRWYRHVCYVFISIIVVLFVFSFNVINKETAEIINSLPKINGYEALLEGTIKALRVTAKPVAFLLIPILFYLIFNTSYTIIRIIKKALKSEFNLTIFFYCFVLILLNSIFAGSICYIGDGCLQLNYGPSILLDIIWKNVWLQGGIVVFFFLCFRSKIILIIRLILVILAIVFFIFLISHNKSWINKTINPAIEYFHKDRITRMQRAEQMREEATRDGSGAEDGMSPSDTAPKIAKIDYCSHKGLAR